MPSVPFAPLHAVRSIAILGAFALPALRSGAAVADRATPLPAVITTATRTPVDPWQIGSAVDFWSPDELARRQVSTLGGALGAAAGAPVVASGAAGGTTSLFLRGANSNQTLFLVDGLRINDPNTDYAVWLGGACIGACDSLEIARGPQSTLYGGEAMGGVVSLQAQRGSGGPSGRVAVEAGSFGTLQGSIAAQGERGATAYNLSAAGGRTDNERANNNFRSSTASLRLDHAIDARRSVGATLRWFNGRYGDPGDRYTNDPDNASREDNVLATTYAEVKFGPGWSGRALLGGQARRFVSENPWPGGPAQITVVKNRRGVFDAQATHTGGTGHRFIAGTTAEANHTRNTGFGDIDRRQTLLAVFAQEEFSPARDVFLTAGLRNDDFDTFGRATTGRATGAWLLADRALKLRATYGTAFRSPSFLDLYGRSAFYEGNPGLEPERARGWDAGLDYALANRRVILGLTWFETRFSDLIASTPDFRSMENIQRARTRGVEFSTRLALRALEARATYTYLEADNLTAGTRLLRRPRHRAALDGWRDFGAGFSGGAGVVWAAQREDFHARSYARIDGEDYTVVRLYAAWAQSSRLTFRARVENLLDERYEEVNGYPALGLGVFGSVEWRW